jgi:phosphohistidine phosphatase SixA
MLRTATAAALAAFALLLPALPAGAADLPPQALVAALRGGGHVIYIRHAATEADYADQVNADPLRCSTQRALGEAGWHQARAIGRAFERLGIPVGEVHSSQYCRAWQTADLAFGRYTKHAALNFEPAEEYDPEQLARMKANVGGFLAQVPGPGVNTVVVGHDDPFEAATGIYPEPMGVAIVVRPAGDGSFAVLGAIPPDAWHRLP